MDNFQNIDKKLEKVESATKESSKDESNKIIEWVIQIKDPNLRENALVELSKKRESFPDLAIYLWYSAGTVASLLQEIINTYKILSPSLLTMPYSNRVCNVLALFQCIAAHSDTRLPFLNAQIPIFLYPFLNTVNKSKPFEYLRLTALGVIGALVKSEDPEIIKTLISTEIIPLSLRIMDRGTELSKTVATFIIQRIILDNAGLAYVCNTAERFHAVNSVLANMLSNNPSTRLLKHIIRCYSRMAENHRARSILKENFPPILREKSFYEGLDEGAKKWLVSFLKTLGIMGTQKTENPQPETMNYNLMNNQNKMQSFNFQGGFEYDLN